MKYIIILFLTFITAEFSSGTSNLNESEEGDVLLTSKESSNGFELTLSINRSIIDKDKILATVEIERVSESAGVITVSGKYLDFVFTAIGEDDAELNKSDEYKKRTEGIFHADRIEKIMEKGDVYSDEFEIMSMFQLAKEQKFQVSVSKSIGSLSDDSFEYISTEPILVNLSVTK